MRRSDGTQDEHSETDIRIDCIRVYVCPSIHVSVVCISGVGIRARIDVCIRMLVGEGSAKWTKA